MFEFAGFGVGHMRDTKTKGICWDLVMLPYCPGCTCLFILDITHCILYCSSVGIWVWGTPIEVAITGVKTSVFFLDTEGFESIGKSNVYDDR